MVMNVEMLRYAKMSYRKENSALVHLCQEILAKAQSDKGRIEEVFIVCLIVMCSQTSQLWRPR